MALYTSYMYISLYTHANSSCSSPGLQTFGTLSRNICAVYCGQTWVISACVSGWKKKSVSLSWSSQQSLFAQTQSCGKCSPCGFFFLFPSSEQRESNHSWRKTLFQNICYVLCPMWHSIQGETLLQGCKITIIHTWSPAITTVKTHGKWWENIFEYLLLYTHTNMEALVLHPIHVYSNHLKV